MRWNKEIVQAIVFSKTTKSDFWTFSPMFSWVKLLKFRCKVKKKKIFCSSSKKKVIAKQSVMSEFWKYVVRWSCSPFCEQVITNLVKMVKARDIRRPFCPSGHWLSEEVNIRADKVRKWKGNLFIQHLWCNNSNNVLEIVTIKGDIIFYQPKKCSPAGHPVVRPICSKRVANSKDGSYRAPAVYTRWYRDLFILVIKSPN